MSFFWPNSAPLPRILTRQDTLEKVSNAADAPTGGTATGIASDIVLSSKLRDLADDNDRRDFRQQQANTEILGAVAALTQAVAAIGQMQQWMASQMGPPPSAGDATDDAARSVAPQSRPSAQLQQAAPSRPTTQRSWRPPWQASTIPENPLAA